MAILYGELYIELYGELYIELYGELDMQNYLCSMLQRSSFFLHMMQWRMIFVFDNKYMKVLDARLNSIYTFGRPMKPVFKTFWKHLNVLFFHLGVSDQQRLD